MYLPDFKRIYGVTMGTLENQWQIWLTTLKQNEKVSTLVAKLSETLPEFKNKRCPSCSSFLDGAQICTTCGLDIKKLS